MDEFDFDQHPPIRIPIKYEGNDYILREATEQVQRDYQNLGIRLSKQVQDGKISSVEGLGDLQSHLVSGCLFKIDDKGKEIPVKKQELFTWTGKIVKKLFEKAKEISGIASTTPEALRKQITLLQGQLDKMESEPDQEEQSKNF